MKKYLLSFAVLLSSAMLFTSCIGDDEPGNDEPTYVDVTSGMFILNEGSYYNQVDGSLSYIDYSRNQIYNGVFKDANNRSLGGTPNSMLLKNNRMYIAVTDENRVEVLEMTMKSVAQIEIQQPRELAADDDNVYVSSYDGKVYKIDIKANNIVAVSEQVGECLEGIACRKGYVYVCNAYNQDYTYNTNVVKLNAKDLSKVADVKVACNPTAIKVSKNNLYVLSTGNYADVKSQIQVINEGDNVEYVCDGTLFDVVDDILYVVNSVTDWTTNKTTTEYYTVKEGKKTTFKPFQEVPSPCGIAVDPLTGLLFISSYALDDKGIPAYAKEGYVYVFNYSTGLAYRFVAGVGPCTMAFNVVTYVY